MTENTMRKFILLPLIIALSGTAYAQHAPDGRGGGPDAPPPHGMPMPPPGDGPMGGVPSPEMLALIPGLTVAQQIEVRKILIARRDASDALRDKERIEHERVDDQSAERLRKLLGEDGYRTFAQSTSPHGPGLDESSPHGDRPSGPDRNGPGDKTRPQPPGAPSNN